MRTVSAIIYELATGWVAAGLELSTAAEALAAVKDQSHKRVIRSDSPEILAFSWYPLTPAGRAEVEELRKDSASACVIPCPACGATGYKDREPWGPDCQRCCGDQVLEETA